MKSSPFSTQLIFARLLMGSGIKDFTMPACEKSYYIDS